MGTPITWQNVNGPDNRLAAQLFEGAQSSINSGLDRFSKIISDREKSDQVLADRARMATQEEYLNMVQGFKTPEELQAARMSGVLDQRLAALDPRNQAAVRGAVDARVTGLQGQVTANDTFQVNQAKQPMVMDNALADVANAPRQRALDLLALGHKEALTPISNEVAIATANNNKNTAELTGRLAPITNANTEATANEMAASLRDTIKTREVDAFVNNSIAEYRKSGGGSDTEAKANILRDLVAKGYSPSQIARVAPGLDLALNTGPIAPIGNDLSKFNSQIAKHDAVKAQLENQYGVKTEPGSVGPLLKDGLAVIDSVLPKDSARSEIYKERLGVFLNKGGIKNTLKDADGNPVLEDGKPIVNRVLPTAAQLQVIISSIDKKWHNTRLSVGGGGMQGEIDDALEAWAKSPEALKGAAELTKLEFTRQLQAVKRAEAPAAPLPAVLGGKK